jgi:hypothetical protein
MTLCTISKILTVWKEMIYNMKAAKRPPNKAKEPVAMLAEPAPVA